MKKMLSYALGAAALLATSALAQDSYDDTYTDPDRGTDGAADRAIDRAADRAVDRAADRAIDGEADRDRDNTPDRKLDRPKRVGMEVQVGGGVQGFIDRAASNVAKPGGDWTARLIVGTRSHIAGEAAYLGSAHNLDTLGVSDEAVLLSNGFEGALRVNILTGAWQPYAVAGYTWRRYQVTNTEVNTSSVAEADNVSAIPVGVGMAWRFNRLVADLRVTFHGAFGRELIPNANLSTLSGNAKLGFEF